MAHDNLIANRAVGVVGKACSEQIWALTRKNTSYASPSRRLPGDLPQKWGFVKDGKEGGFRKSLGWWLRNHEGRYAGGWTLLSAGKDGYERSQYYIKTPGGA